jgi:phage FluMu gp28-like protein
MFTGEQRLAFCDAYIRYGDAPLALDRWQELYVSDASRFSIILKGRREGFSFASALKGLVKALDPDRQSYTRQYVSYNFEDATEKIRAAATLYDSIPKRIQKPLVTRNKTRLEFLDNNGKTTSRLVSIACRPPRGLGGDIVLDEFAIYKKNMGDAIYTAALPVLSRGGCMEIGSTPLGRLGKFYEIWNGRESFKNFTRFTVPWWQSAALCADVETAREAKARDMETEERVERFGKEVLQNIFSNSFLEEFQQEYECVFIDSAESYISLDLIDANTPGMREADWNRMGADSEGEIDVEVHVFKDADSLCLGYIPEKHGRLFMGYDVARRRDAAVIFVIGLLSDGKKISVAEIVMVNKDFECQLDGFRKIMRGLPVVRACVDQTGQGEMVTEVLRREFGTSRVEGVIFNTQSKGELAIGVRQGLERREFLLQNEERFRRQIHGIKRTPTSGGAFRYDSERDENGHADSFWAWALADHAVIKNAKARPGFYQKWREKREGGGLPNEAESAGAAGAVQKRGRSAEQAVRDMYNGMRGAV